MKKIKNQILGLVAFFLLCAGLSATAERLDPIQNQVEIKPAINEFASFCGTGMNPRPGGGGSGSSDSN